MHRNRPDYELLWKGINLLVKNGVFTPDPDKTNSTSIILNNLPDIQGKDILDMGCGTGIIGIYCALNGARKVVAVDVDKNAVENTRENIKRNNAKNIEVILSNLFEHVMGSFDYIFGNLPIHDPSWDLGISTTELLKKFLRECKDYVHLGGAVYFTWNSDQDIAPVKEFLQATNYLFEEIIEEKSNKTWHLFQIRF